MPKRTVDDLLSMIQTRRVAKQRRKCAHCRNDEAVAALERAVKQIQRAPGKFEGLTLRDLYEWTGAVTSQRSESSYRAHLKHHAPQVWEVLAGILRQADV